MARDSKGRFLPVTCEEDWGDGRHALSRAERSKGYANAPSRIRSRIRSLYRGKKIGKKGA